MSLLALQRDVRDWLTMESADAAARFEANAAPGLSVYLNTYRAQLMACLAESFATTHAWLGDEAFEAAAARHIDRLPPHSWTLDAYALDFPATLDLLYADDPEVGELARLEHALGLAFIGPDAEPIDPATLSEVDWDHALIRFVPTLATLAAHTNAGAIWSAIAAETSPPAAVRLPQPTEIAIWRNGFMPAFRTLEPEEAEELALIASGLSFGGLCAHLVKRHGAEDGPAIAGARLGQWLQDGMITSITMGEQA